MAQEAFTPSYTAPALVARPDLAPADEHEVVLVADWTARRDVEGRIQFSAWWFGYIPGVEGLSVRGQVFLGRPEGHAAQWEAAGYTIRAEQETGVAR